MVFSCMGSRVGSNTEDAIKESDPGVPSDICHSGKFQSKNSGWRSERLGHLVWMGNRQWGTFI